MIPQLLLLSIFAVWIYTAFRSRFQSTDQYQQYRVTLIFIGVFLAILYWGNFLEYPS